mmetsp:Transcript_26303/g.88418  ORF Transcript_26303/g.88418 Transcript_26303/m.88418 type:complete len:202 (-) Transcript_26303:315-920(-)
MHSKAMARLIAPPRSTLPTRASTLALPAGPATAATNAPNRRKAQIAGSRCSGGVKKWCAAAARKACVASAETTSVSGETMSIVASQRTLGRASRKSASAAAASSSPGANLEGYAKTTAASSARACAAAAASSSRGFCAAGGSNAAPLSFQKRRVFGAGAVRQLTKELQASTTSASGPWAAGARMAPTSPTEPLLRPWRHEP